MADRWPDVSLRVFEALFTPWRRRRLHRIHMAGVPAGGRIDMPLLIVANHTSWWDGFVILAVRRRLRPRGPFRAVVSETELRRHPVLGWIGGVPLQPGSPGSALRAFRGLRRLRVARPDLSVLFFPQGRIWPSHRRPLGFQRGVTTLSRLLAPVVVLPVGLHYEPLTHARPSAFVSVGPIVVVPAGGPGAGAAGLDRAVAAELDRILAFLARHGEDAPRLWPGPWSPLPDPEPGTGEGLPFPPRLQPVPRGEPTNA
jgi:1-acyl-sn-glycerol-3-phosphate acyltransferase